MKIIQANESGTRTIAITESHFKTLEKYALLSDLIDSNGIVDESVLEKLQLNVRSLLDSSTGEDHKDLINLALDVVYNLNMKALGLHNLALAYVEWKSNK